MSERIELSKSRARKLIKAWEGHIKEKMNTEDCAIRDVCCPIHKYFIELKKVSSKKIRQVKRDE